MVISKVWQGKELRNGKQGNTERKDGGGIGRTTLRTGMGGKAPSSVNTAAGRKKNVAKLTKILYHIGNICQGLL